MLNTPIDWINFTASLIAIASALFLLSRGIYSSREMRSALSYLWLFVQYLAAIAIVFFVWWADGSQDLFYKIFIATCVTIVALVLIYAAIWESSHNKQWQAVWVFGSVLLGGGFTMEIWLDAHSPFVWGPLVVSISLLVTAYIGAEV
jgi:hypothetical protein